jgi:hypothetical protein
MTRLSAGILLAALLAIAPPGRAQPVATPPFTGSASLGTRSLDVEGTDAKFREDLNLDAGPRLFDLRLRYEPEDTAGAAVDRLELDAQGFGGDPFENLRFSVRNFGRYRVALNRHRSKFFYDDTILPAALASVSGSTGGDFHRFDFERTRTTADVEIDVTPATQLSLGLERQTRTGASATTLTVERDEFDFDRPLDESLDGLTFGVRHAWRRATLIVTEELGDFRNTSELVLPGASPGRNLADGASLSFFTRDQSYDYATRAHGLRVLASPTARIDLTAAWRRDDLDLHAYTSEQALGTTFSGAPLATAAAGPATIDRDIETAELDVGVALTERIRLIGAARRQTLEQRGELVYGADSGTGAWSIDTDGLEAGVELALSSALTVAAGWSTETRDADFDWTLTARAAQRPTETDRDGYFARLELATESGWRLTASLEDNDIAAPYTLASPTDSRRYSVTARRRWQNGLSFNASYRNTDVANDESAWIADTEHTDLRLSYRRERLRLSAGYSRIDLARSVDQRVTAGTRVLDFVIDYATAAMMRDASARWQLNQRFAVGGDLRSYDTHGSVRVAHDDWRGYGEIALGKNYALALAYRDVDYVEDAFDAYDARVLEVVVRLGW